VLLQTGAAYVSAERVYSLYRVIGKFGIVTRLLAGEFGVRISVAASGFLQSETFPSLLLKSIRIIPRGLRGWRVILTTSPHLEPKCKNEWAYTSIPLKRLHGTERQNFTVLITQWLPKWVSTFAWTE
jgi:hypothetical protein